MKLFNKLTLLIGLLGVLTVGSAFGDTLIFRDTFTAPTNFTGFNLNEGANSLINPPEFTRLEGTAVSDLRYSNLVIRSSYETRSNKLRINNGAQVGRFTIGDSTGIFDFGVPLGVGTATPENPIEYEITVSMDNNADTARLSFGLATTTSAVTGWDFGFQIVKSDTNYLIYKRIDSASTGLSNDIDAPIDPIPIINAGSEVDFLMRVTDAGAETDTFSSRVQLFVNGGTEPIYDSAVDPVLVETGWRLDGAARYLIGDIPSGNGAFVTYDNLSVTLKGPELVNLLTPTGTPGNLTIDFTGEPDVTYTIERASTITGTWGSIGTATTDSNGLGTYTDLIDHGAENSFYRTVVSE